MTGRPVYLIVLLMKTTTKQVLAVEATLFAEMNYEAKKVNEGYGDKAKAEAAATEWRVFRKLNPAVFESRGG